MGGGGGAGCGGRRRSVVCYLVEEEGGFHLQWLSSYISSGIHVGKGWIHAKRSPFYAESIFMEG